MLGPYRKSRFDESASFSQWNGTVVALKQRKYEN